MSSTQRPPWIEDPIATDEFPTSEIDANGVDRSQIRRHLELTPGERLQYLEDTLAAIQELRRAIRPTAISSNPDSTR